jgi:hypothetical protein
VKIGSRLDFSSQDVVREREPVMSLMDRQGGPMSRGTRGYGAGLVVLLTTSMLAGFWSQSAIAASGGSPKGSVGPLKGMPQIGRAAEVTPAGVSYFYASTHQYATATGARASLSQPDPALVYDYHSVGEIAAESADGLQIVEVGWTVDPGLNGDTLPHLFVFHWLDGVPTCYNGCGFVQVSTTITPGMALAVTTTPQAYAIRYRLGGWWIRYQKQWVGYFPGSIWSGSYTQLGLAQWFGEIASSSTTPCSDMGNGRFGHQSGAASMTAIRLFGGPSPSISPTVPTPSYYDDGHLKASSFTYGGPGAC